MDAYTLSTVHIVSNGGIYCCRVLSTISVAEFLTIAALRTYCHFRVIFAVQCYLKVVSQGMELARNNFLSMTYCDFRRGLSRQKCIDQLAFAFSYEASLFVSVKSLYNELNRGHRSFADENRADHPNSLIVTESVGATQILIMQDRHVT